MRRTASPDPSTGASPDPGAFSISTDGTRRVDSAHDLFELRADDDDDARSPHDEALEPIEHAPSSGANRLYAKFVSCCGRLECMS